MKFNGQNGYCTCQTNAITKAYHSTVLTYGPDCHQAILPIKILPKNLFPVKKVTKFIKCFARAVIGDVPKGNSLPGGWDALPAKIQYHKKDWPLTS